MIYKILHGQVFIPTVTSPPITLPLIYSILVIPAPLLFPIKMPGMPQPCGLCTCSSLCLAYLSSRYLLCMTSSPTDFRSLSKTTFSVRLQLPLSLKLFLPLFIYYQPLSLSSMLFTLLIYFVYNLSHSLKCNTHEGRSFFYFVHY